jgi:glutamate-ammonia-ligase adenylyltransferase
MDLSHLPPSISEQRLEETIRILEDCSSPDQTAVRLSRILHSPQTHLWIEQTLFRGDHPQPLLAILCQILSQSEFLTSILEREPNLLVLFESEREFSFGSGRAIYEKELHKHLGQLSEGEPFKLGLCRFKLHELFRIAVRDITQRASIEILARELSDLADVVLEAAYQKIYSEVLMTHGVPRIEGDELAGMAILSLGKHGSRELNFSSDLDLILLYSAEGRTDLAGRVEARERWLESHPYARYIESPGPSARTRGVEFEAFFNELGTRLIEMMSEPGPLGMIYRIDMRLRPEGSGGPLVRTLESALQYYQNWGQRWERQALLRSRLSAGDTGLGAKFQKGVEDFIYRKYVDSVEVDETLREMRELRFRSIANAGADQAMRLRNLKNGPGGIRDIEFLVQAVQILYGGQFPELRCGDLFEILRRIHQSGLMSVKDYELLSAGYQFLRRLEHRIQMDDMQRYHLPPQGGKLDTLGHGLGYETGMALETALFETMQHIHSIFITVFRVSEGAESVGNILDQAELSPKWREALISFGLKNPDSVFKSMKTLGEDPDAPHLNSKLKRLFKTILPRLLATIRDTPSPEQAWRVFEAISLGTPARSTFFSIAEENPQLIGLLMAMGSASPYLTDLLLSYRNLLDDLVHRTAFENLSHPADLDWAYEHQEGVRGKGESCLPCLRSFRVRTDIHVAGRFVLGLSELPEAVGELSSLASYCLRKCIEEVWAGHSGEMVVFGLGKFGGKEIGFGSDLDLLILYDGKRQPDIEVPQRLASELIVEMGSRTPDGRLFPVDVRLRPHGKSAPLVLSLEGALDYYRAEGQTWERLAMTRCLPVWGEALLLAGFHQRLANWIYGSPADREVLAEVREMRRRIEREKTDQPLKAGPGGLLDIEFIAQAGQLRWGCEYHSARTPSTLDALEWLRENAILTLGEARTLSDSYLFLRELENRLLLLGKPGARGIPQDHDVLEHLVGCFNTAHHRASDIPGDTFTPQSLVDRDQSARAHAREIFEELFERGFERV